MTHIAENTRGATTINKSRVIRNPNADINLDNIHAFIQDYKIVISRSTLGRLFRQGRWPAEFYSYHTSKTRANLYRDPDRFFKYMHKLPRLYDKRFLFESLVDASAKIAPAAEFALSIVNQKINEYIQAPNVTKRWVGRSPTGWYKDNFAVLVDGVRATSVRQLDNVAAGSTVSIVNTAHYAARTEAIAYYYHQSSVRGIMYYAAQRVRRRYKDLGVRYVYTPPEYVEGAYHPRYPVPTITIGNRADVQTTIRRPGRRSRENRAGSLAGTRTGSRTDRTHGGSRSRALWARRDRLNNRFRSVR
jgi:hypothetical protein